MRASSPSCHVISRGSPRVPFSSFPDLLTALLGIVGALLAVPTAAIVQVLVQELVLRDEAAEPPEPPGEFT